MKTQQPSPWLLQAEALKLLAAGYEKIDLVEKSGGFRLPSFSAVPSLNGKANGHTNGHSNGNGHAAKALPAPQKVRKAAAKALPAPAAAAEAKPKGKPGPKPGAKAAKAAAIIKAKPEKVEKAVKAPKAQKAKGAASNAIAAGRRAVANGDRPKLTEAVAIVMGEETLTAGEILERLQARGWQPGAKNPQSYISYTLGDNEETFKRVERGSYKVIKPKDFVELIAQWKSGKAPANAAAAAAPKAKKAAAKGSKTSGKAERVASTDAGETEVLAAEEPVEAQAVETEAAPVAGDPPTTTEEAEASAPVSTPSPSPNTDDALEDLGLGKTEIEANPFDALS